MIRKNTITTGIYSSLFLIMRILTLQCNTISVPAERQLMRFILMTGLNSLPL